VISDELNHASIIDGIRLSKARRLRYRHNDLEDLRAQLRQADADGARFKLVFSDGVFSMDGTVARLDEIRKICDEQGAARHRRMPRHGLHGRAWARHARGARGVRQDRHHHGHAGQGARWRVGRLYLRAQGSRRALAPTFPTLSFSNTVAPAIVGGSIAVLDILEGSTELRDRLEQNTRFFREGIAKLGFDIKPGDHPIVPIMVYDAEKAQQLADRLLELGCT
jgi:glycine C-acetyltransferase